jgi:hypothetical protein
LRARVCLHLLQSRLYLADVICFVVVNMAKEKQWEDVRLLSFDLQTVEYTYASVRITPSPHTTSAHVHNRTTRFPSLARTSYSRAVRTTCALAAFRPVMRPMTTDQTRTPRLSLSSTHSYAMAGSLTLSRHSFPSYVIRYPCLRFSRAYRPARYPRLLAGGV